MPREPIGPCEYRTLKIPPAASTEHVEPDHVADPLFCGAPGIVAINGASYCAEHLDHGMSGAARPLKAALKAWTR